jgi:hypothetical protein
MQESCAIKLLQPRLNIPEICDTRILEITHTIWTQLEKKVFFFISQFIIHNLQNLQ